MVAQYIKLLLLNFYLFWPTVNKVSCLYIRQSKYFPMQASYILYTKNTFQFTKVFSASPKFSLVWKILLPTYAFPLTNTQLIHDFHFFIIQMILHWQLLSCKTWILTLLTLTFRILLLSKSPKQPNTWSTYSFDSANRRALKTYNNCCNFHFVPWTWTIHCQPIQHP